MIRPSVQLKQALARLTMPVLFVLCFAIMLIGKADTVVIDRLRVGLGDALGPAYAALSVPLRAIGGELRGLAGLFAAREENRQLRAELARLRAWQDVALTLEDENRRLKAELHWIPDPQASFVTARVVADAGGLYARAALLSVGPSHVVHKGDVALDGAGLVGRVTEVGSRTARVLLITDLSSRIPVRLEKTHGRAILAGTNAARPRLLYWTDGSPEEGERVVTSGEAGALPANLPVGVVHWTAARVPEVAPTANLNELGILRLFDFQSALAGRPAG